MSDISAIIKGAATLYDVFVEYRRKPEDEKSETLTTNIIGIINLATIEIEGATPDHQLTAELDELDAAIDRYRIAAKKTPENA